MARCPQNSQLHSLNGEISLPPDHKTSHYRLVLSVVPGINSNRKIHPCMLHAIIMDASSKQKRARFRTELKSPEDWKIILDVVNGEVYYVPNYGETESLKVDCLREGKLVLGQSNLQVNLKYQISNLHLINYHINPVTNNSSDCTS